MKTCLIQLKIGDPVIYEHKDRNIRMNIMDYKLVPNGMDKPEIVCLIKAESKDGFIAEATSDNFIIIDDEEYKTVYSKDDYK